MKRATTWIFLGAAALLGVVSPAAPEGTPSAADKAHGGGEKPREDSGLLWLVNGSHHVSPEYEAADMKEVKNSQVRMRSAAVSALEQMTAALKNAGCSIQIESGYRTYDRQKYLFTTRIADKQKKGMSYEEAYNATKEFTAVPGTSEHQLGLAVDLSTDGTLTSAFAGTPQGKWLKENAWRYGFILRYEQEKHHFTQIGEEPWHFRYVGTPHAQIMHEKGWCLEEYMDFLKENKYISLASGGMVYEIYRTEGDLSGYRNVIGISADNCGGTIVTTYHPADQ